MSAPSAQPRRRPGLSLAMLVAILAVAELLVNRIVCRLLHVDWLVPRTVATRIVDNLGLFLFFSASVLAVLTLAAALVRAAIGNEFRNAARATFPVVGAFFVPLAALGATMRLPGQLLFHLQVSLLFLCLLFSVATLGSPAEGRVKLGALGLLFGLGLELVPNIVARLPGGAEHVDPLLPLLGLLPFAGGALLLVPARGRRRYGVIAAAATGGAAAALMLVDGATASRLASYGFGVSLLPHPAVMAGAVAVIAASSYAIVRLVALPGVHRLRGLGVLLIALGGVSHVSPHLMTLVALGFLCIAVAAQRPDGKPISRADFEALVRGVAVGLGTPQATVTGREGFETVRLHAPAGQRPLELVLERRYGAIALVEITVGEAPPREPSFSLQRIGQGSLGPHPDGARVATEDAEFDAELEVFDRRGAGAAVLDEPTRARIRRLVAGWLGVWPQRGVRYRALQLPGGEEELLALVQLLREIADRTA